LQKALAYIEFLQKDVRRLKRLVGEYVEEDVGGLDGQGRRRKEG
jgi:hypothetical protein